MNKNIKRLRTSIIALFCLLFVSGISLGTKISIQAISAKCSATCNKTKLEVGEKVQINIINNNNYYNVTCTTDDSTAFKVTDEGIVTCVGSGVAEVSVVFTRGTSQVVIPFLFVAIVKPTSITLDIAEELCVGTVISPLPLMYTPWNASRATVKFVNSSRSDVASFINSDTLKLYCSKVGTTNLILNMQGMDGTEYRIRKKLVVYGLDENGEKYYGIDSFSMTLPKSELVVGGEMQAVTQVQPANAKINRINWVSSNTAIAKVDADGKITALRAGKTTITATAITPDEQVPATKELTVYAVGEDGNKYYAIENFAIKAAHDYVGVGNTYSLSYTVTPSGAEGNCKVNWISQNTDVATIDSSGRVKGVSLGKATIVAKLSTPAGNYEASISISVVEVGLDGEVLRPIKNICIPDAEKEIVIFYPETYSINLNITPSNTNQAYIIDWKSTNNSVATVSGSANVLWISPWSIGKCKITGKVKIDSKVVDTLTCNVEVKQRT